MEELFDKLEEIKKWCDASVEYTSKHGINGVIVEGSHLKEIGDACQNAMNVVEAYSLGEQIVGTKTDTWGDWVTKYCHYKKISKTEFARRTFCSIGAVLHWTTHSGSGTFDIVQGCLDKLGYEMVIRRKIDGN